MLISVIIPLYKGKKFIQSCIDMIEKANTYTVEKYKNNFNVEIIFINDYPQEYIDISLYRKNRAEVMLFNNGKNIGIHGSRIAGYYKAKGEYLLFLDQDDEIKEEYFYSQLSNIGSYDYCVSGGYNRHEDGKLQPLYKDEKYFLKTLDLNCMVNVANLIESPGQVLIKKNSIPEKWLTRVLKNNGVDDMFLWILMLAEGKVGCTNYENLFVHVYIGTNASKNYAVMVESFKEMLENLYDILPRRKRNFMLRRYLYQLNWENRTLVYKIKNFDVALVQYIYNHYIL